MSYEKRNTLVLGGILLMVILTGLYLVFIDHPQVNKAMQAKLTKLQKDIATLEGVVEDEVIYAEMLANQEAKLALIDKDITTAITPDRTYDYLNDIMTRVGSLPLNLRFYRTEKAESYGFQVYHLEGESSFDRIYQFIRLLEKGPIHIRIRHFSMRGVEEGGQRRRTSLVMPFELEIAAYFSTFDELPNKPVELASIPIRRVNNPFQPLLKRSLPANAGKLLEVERASLQALVPGKALIADHNGKIHELGVGDRVYLGYLSDLRLADDEVEFVLNKGGVVKKFILTFNFRR